MFLDSPQRKQHCSQYLCMLHLLFFLTEYVAHSEWFNSFPWRPTIQDIIIVSNAHGMGHYSVLSLPLWVRLLGNVEWYIIVEPPMSQPTSSIITGIWHKERGPVSIHHHYRHLAQWDGASQHPPSPQSSDTRRGDQPTPTITTYMWHKGRGPANIHHHHIHVTQGEGASQHPPSPQTTDIRRGVFYMI